MVKESREYSISELSREFNLTPRSIRFYEDKGLIQPKREGKHRIYSHQDRVRLILIMRGKRLGFAISEIKELLDLWDHTPQSSAAQLQQILLKITDKRSELDQQLRDIAILQMELDKAEQHFKAALEEIV